MAAFSQTLYDARTALLPCALEGRVEGRAPLLRASLSIVLLGDHSLLG